MSMRVWLDALTPKQLLFLAAIEEELRRSGYEVLLTTRRYDELDVLEDRLSIETMKVGSHGGDSLEGKLEASLNRLLDLYRVVKSFAPNVTVTTASPEAARISYGLGIPLLVFNDSPHSVAVARLVAPLAKGLYSPWLIRKSDWLTAGVIPENYSKYRAIDPVAWLRRRHLWPSRQPWEDARNSVVIRAGESKAYYYRGTGEDAFELAKLLSHDYEVVVLSRYSGRESSNVRVIGPGFFGPNVLEGALAFVGFGGTMSQEALLLGIPTISAYPGEYRLEQELVRRGLIFKAGSLRDAVDLVHSAVENAHHIRARADAFNRGLVDPAKYAAHEVLRMTGRSS